MALGLLIATTLFCKFGNAATTYYVDAAVGKDSYQGTSSSPLQTIQAAADIVNPGDTVVVRKGTYTTTNSAALVDINFGGSAGNPVTFKAENPLGAKLDGKSNYTSSGWIIEPGVAYVNIQGFDLANFGKSAFNVSSQNNNIGIIGNHIHDIGRLCTDTALGLVGVYVGVNSASISIRNNVIHDLGRYAPAEKGCTPGNTYYQNHDHAIYIDGVSNITIQDNMIYNISRGWGIQFYSGSNVVSTGVSIINNTFSYPNPYRDGHILFASPGVTQVSVTNNAFNQPTNQAININSGIILSNVSINNNRVYSSVISKYSSTGVSFSANTVIK